jgi:hypothetical protein
MKKTILALSISTIWITFWEFLRNEILFKSYWTNHFESLGLKFETLPLNGILWMLWSFLLTLLVFKLLQKFSWKETLLLSWISSFLMMWITAFNLQVLPLTLLLIAIPLSFIEILVAILIIKKIGI